MQRITKLLVGLWIVCICFLSGAFVLAEEIPSPPKPPEPEYRTDKIVVAMRAEFSDYKSIVPLLEEYERETGIRVEHIDFPASALRDNLITTLATGASTYDVILMDIIFIPEFAAAGFLTPLDGSEDPFIAYTEEDLADYFPGSIAASSYEGHLYAKDYSGDVGMLFCREDLLKDAGFNEPPKTWEELAYYATKLTKDFDGDGITDQWGYAFTAKEFDVSLCIFNELVAQAGGSLIDEQKNIHVNDAPAVEALQFLVDLYNNKVIPPGVTTYMEKDVHAGFLGEKFAMVRNWPYMWAMCEAPDSRIKGKVVMTSLPCNKRCATTMGGWFFGIAAGSQRKRAAWELIEYLTSHDASVYMCYKSGDFPYRRSFFEDPRTLKDLSWTLPLQSALETAVPRPTIPEWGAMSRPLWTEIGAAFLGKSPQKALDDVAREWEKILKR